MHAMDLYVKRFVRWMFHLLSTGRPRRHMKSAGDLTMPCKPLSDERKPGSTLHELAICFQLLDILAMHHAINIAVANKVVLSVYASLLCP